MSRSAPTPAGMVQHDGADGRNGRRFGRRTLLASSGALLGVGAGACLVREHFESFQQAEVFIAPAESYQSDLKRSIREGLAELGWGPGRVKGKSVLLKPNLVEPASEAPQINTHPALVLAAAEVFRSWDAREVFVAEGQGHCRDTDLVLEQSGLGPILARSGIAFVDLNHDEVEAVANRSGWTRLRRLHLPESLRRADVIVSMPKMKTHHWAGVTLAMKNLFGVMPGVCYGWPKNVLHQVGIPQAILDINAAVGPHLAIVDGVVGMEGDGPIMGTPVPSGVIVLGTNLPAVDATTARLMGLDPQRIPYLAAASGWLGPIAERNIRQRGATITALARSFAVIDHPSLKFMRAAPGVKTRSL